MTYEEAQQTSARWLREAGITPGMRVLDAGCGPGSVTALLFGLLEGRGEVVGLDRDPAFLAQAAARHAGQPLRLHEVDLAGELPELGEFDAVVARRVLLYLPDPAAGLRRLVARLRPGGLVFVQDFVLLDAPTGLPLHDAARRWIVDMLAAEGAPADPGRRLPALFAAAGLPFPVMRAEAEVAAPGQGDTLADKVRFVLPRILATGVDPAEVGVESLAERLRAERDAAALPWLGELAVAAWART